VDILILLEAIDVVGGLAGPTSMPCVHQRRNMQRDARGLKTLQWKWPLASPARVDYF
jgi:hypothetical protein